VSELQRRLVHAAGTAIPGLYLLDVLSWRELGLFLVVATGVALVLEAVRLFVGLDWMVYERLTREYEQEYLAGYALYFLGMTAVALVFAPRVAVPGMLMLTVADPASGLLGGGDFRRIKRLPVLLATFGLCLVLAVPFVPLLPATLGALAATAADGAKPVVGGYVIDDNLTIPLAAAAAIQFGLGYAPELLG
jgi:dolichol kinase